MKHKTPTSDGMSYEEMPLKKPKLVKKGKSYQLHVKVKRQKRPSLIKAYWNYMLEVILK